MKNKEIPHPIDWSFNPSAKAITYDIFKGPELRGKKLGLIGFGAIGRRVAKRASGFEMKILVFDPYVEESEMVQFQAKKVDLVYLLQESDFVCLHCKVTQETRGMINEKTLKRMKSTAFLINVAQGGIIDEYALAEALKNRQIAGAALDVFAVEPISSTHPLLALDNVTLTPHLAGASWEVCYHHSIILASDIERILKGMKPLFIVNPEVLETKRISKS